GPCNFTVTDASARHGWTVRVPPSASYACKKIERTMSALVFFPMMLRPPGPKLFPYTTLSRSPGASWSRPCGRPGIRWWSSSRGRSEEHTSELQSQSNLVCRLLLEKKKVELVDLSHSRA